MERTKYRLIVIALIFFAFNLKGSNRSEIYNFYIDSRMKDWKNVIDQLNNKLGKNNDLLIELVNYQYGYIGWCMGNNRNDDALLYLKLAENNIKILENSHFQPSMINAYKAALYGYRIGLNNLTAPFIGPKSFDCAKHAVKLDPNNAFAYIQLGNVKFHAPVLMGGSKTEAIIFFLTAKTLMEKNAAQIHGDWNYLSLLVTIAKAYISLEDFVKAKSMYEEILKFEPDFKWVKDELYPQLLKKIK